jgi:hypothetical protein
MLISDMYWVSSGLVITQIGVNASFLPLFIEPLYKQHRELSLVISKTTFCVDPSYHIENENLFYAD